MQTPQLENGYVKIANEIIEALSKNRIPGEQMQCLLFILRKTYGFNKINDRISNSQFVSATGINKRNVKRAIDGLIGKRIVVKKDNEYIPTYQFNKDYRLWRKLSKKTPVVKIDTAVVKKDNKLLSKKTPTKDIKDNIQKTVFLSDSNEIRLSELLFSLMLTNNPKAKKPNFQVWAKHIDLAHRIDNREFKEIEDVIRWSQRDSFWMYNILSTDKLRKQFDRLFLKMNEKGPVNGLDEFLRRHETAE